MASFYGGRPIPRPSWAGFAVAAAVVVAPVFLIDAGREAVSHRQDRKSGSCRLDLPAATSRQRLRALVTLPINQDPLRLRLEHAQSTGTLVLSDQRRRHRGLACADEAVGGEAGYLIEQVLDWVRSNHWLGLDHDVGFCKRKWYGWHRE